jgi:hypothetical protein
MSKFRNNRGRVLSVVITLIAAIPLVWPNVPLAQKKVLQEPTVTNPAVTNPAVTNPAVTNKVTKPKVKPKIKSIGANPPAPNFVPKEKVSAGKPVSFPSDI